MKKSATRFVCRNCGAETSSWSGKCFTCGEWNTLEEEVSLSPTATAGGGHSLKAWRFKEVAQTDGAQRLVTGLPQLDTVLGGGLVAGSVNLIAGEPGIGKSTILLQVAQAVAAKQSVLYVSGEESAHQLGLRAQRLGASNDHLAISTSNSTDDIAATIARGDYRLVIVDSIQTISCQAVGSAAGSVSQITNSAHLLSAAAKGSNTALVIVGHVTKEGSIAGP
jgi:DNA repair protein RadA/Sms